MGTSIYKQSAMQNNMCKHYKKKNSSLQYTKCFLQFTEPKLLSAAKVYHWMLHTKVINNVRIEINTYNLGQKVLNVKLDITVCIVRRSN